MATLFTNWVSHLLNKYVDPLILGDFNVNLAKQSEPNSAAFLELLETYGLMPCGNLLDHVITREASSAVLDKPMILVLVSDHRLIIIGLPKHQAPGKTTMVRFMKLNDISTQVIQQNFLMCSNLARKQMIKHLP